MDVPKQRVDAQTGDLLLSAFRPIARLRVRRAGPPVRPRFPVIEAHTHLGQTPFSGAWATGTAEELAAVMDAASVTAVVDLDGGWGDRLERELARWRPLGDRVAVFAGLAYEGWAQQDDFGEREARRLRTAVGLGARGLKVWKTLGLRAVDRTGSLVPVDDPRLDPLWAAAGELGVPVTIHVADPMAFFEPLDATNERWEELREHPDWHFWLTRPRGRPEVDGFEPAGFPPFDELIDGLEAVVVRHPGTTFIGAHVGCAAEDLGRVSAILERCANFHVDLAARIGELGRQPYTARAFMLRWSDRVLFGTDAPPDPAWWATYERFLETADESFPYEPDDGPGSQGRWLIHGLDLPDDVLRGVYHQNAVRLVFGAAALPELPPTSERGKTRGAPHGAGGSARP